jgi:hypothetical protein
MKERILRYRAAAWTLLMLAFPICQGLSTSDAWAQHAAVQGIVIDRTTAQPLSGAAVVLEQAGEEVRSMLTDRNGLFQIAGLAAGAYRLRIILLGYATHEETIDLRAGQRLTANRALAVDPLQLEGIGVTGQGPGAVRRELGRQTITAREIGRIPTPAAGGDLASYLQALPGVVGSGDRGGQLFIRGGTPSENLVLMDGMPIYQPFHITGFFSVFPEDLVDRAEFFPGGFGPKYSGRLSSVLEVGMRDGNRNQRALTASVSPFLVDVLTEGSLPGDAGQHSYLVSVRRSLIEETSPWLLGKEQPLRFDSYYLKLSSLGHDGGSRCSLTGLRSNDRGGLDPEDEESRVWWRNFLIGGRCTSLAGETFLDGRFGFSRLRSGAITRGASAFSSSVSRIFMDVDASRTFRRIRFNFGGFTHFKHARHDFLEFFAQHDAADFWTGFGAYAEAEIPVGGGIRLLPGAATSWYPGTFSAAIEPRLRASWRPRFLDDAELSGALGLHGQRIAGITDRRDAGSVFTAWTPAPDDSRLEAIHAQTSWQQRFGAWFSWSVDGYYRRMRNLPVTTWSTIATFTPDLSFADGRAYGADARVEYRRAPFYAFGGYGYGWTQYSSAQDDFGVWFGEPVQYFRPPHDRRHQANALASLDLGRYSFAARWEFGSGLPFTRPIGFDELFDFRTDLPNVTRSYGQTRLLLDRPYNGRLPPTHRLDLSMERVVDIGSRQIQLQAGVINVYDQNNLFYYDVFTHRRIDQMPFAPFLSVRLQPRSSSRR